MQLSQLVNVKQRKLVDATSAFRLENGPSAFLHLAFSCPVKPYNRDIAIEGILAQRIQHFEYEPLVASESLRPNQTDVKTLHSSRKYGRLRTRSLNS